MPVVGVVGTMVWDTIQRDDGAGSRFEGWGGISYALAAADAVEFPDFRIRPVIKLGRDLAARALLFLNELSVIEKRDAVVIVDEPNPRVELHYHGEIHRCERLQGGVPPWSWPQLEQLIRDCDALYVNFITGSELDLTVAQQLRRSFDGPIYADIHSLMLATGQRGERSPRRLERWAEWLDCFDVVQLNEDELVTLSAHGGDPWAFAAEVVGRRVELLFVTRGAEGALYFMAGDALPLEGRRGRRLGSDSPLRTGKVETREVRSGDPTGCGDVWGITAFSALLAGDEVESAMRRANAAASRNAQHRGAVGLNRFLKG
jgi:sugar/nucleoside kinase (ribokinase family)